MSGFSKDFIHYSLANFVSLLLGVVLLAGLSSQLEPEVYGQYGFYMSIFSIILVFVNWGRKEKVYKLAITHAWNPRRYEKKQVAFFNLIVVFTLPLLLINQTLFLVVVFALLFSLFQSKCFYQRGINNYLVDGWSMPLYRLNLVVIVFALFFLFSSSEVSVDYLILASCISIFVINVFFLKIPILQLPVNKIRVTFPKWNFFIAIELISIAYLKVDVIIGSFLLGFEQIASYFFSIQVFEAVLVLLLPICHIFIGKVKGNSSPHYELKYALMVVAITLFGLSVFLLIGDYFINAWLPHYQNAFYFIAALIVVAGIATLNSFYSMLLILKNKERLYFKIVLYCFVGYIVITPPLALFYSVKGLVIGKLLIETLIFVGMFICYRRLNNENCL